MNWTRRQFLAASGLTAMAACAPAQHQGKDADVLILGAGLAGLHAARMLSADGANVIVLDADSRVGGRMVTLDDLPGRPEAGGQQVGQSYARIRSTALDVGLNIVPFPPGGSRDKTMILGDQVFDARDWATSPQNPFPEAFKRATPDTALFMAAARANPLVDQYAWREVGPEVDISADAFLAAQGFDERSRALCDIALNANALNSYSMLNVWRSMVLFQIDSQTGPSEEVEGGSQRLPEAMAESLPDGSVRLNSTVKAIEMNADRVTVTTDAGSLSAPFVISTLPFPVMSKLGLPAELEARRPIIRDMPYTQIQQVHLALDGQPTDDLPLMMWTDTPIERVFPVRDKTTGEPVALTCWINGTGIREAASDEDWKSLAEDTLLQKRGIKATALNVTRWDSQTSLAGGAYMHWAPGQVPVWAEEILKPVGRLHFAGEHTSFLHTGMEGAMESAERAAYAIIEEMAGV
jgi:monoamine oxidase